MSSGTRGWFLIPIATVCFDTILHLQDSIREIVLPETVMTFRMKYITIALDDSTLLATD